MRIGFVVLAHQDPAQTAELADALCGCQGASVVLHYDRNSPAREFDFLRAQLSSSPILWPARIRCGWGQFSLVEATLSCLAALKVSGAPCDYVYLLSGSDLPIKPLASLQAFLAAQAGLQFIESIPIRERRWVRGGIEEERFVFHHWINQRRRKRWFDLWWRTQRKLGLRRTVPSGLELSLGSQWWCLTWPACLDILALCERRPQITRFFRRTWIPDESFFQTLIRQVVGPEKLSSCSLTYSRFDESGRPTILTDAARALLLDQEQAFFARKADPAAQGLRRYFLDLARSPVEAVDWKRNR